MKNILNEPNKIELLKRIEKVKESNKALWGKMSVNEMLCHLADQVRVSLQLIKTKDASSFLTRNVAAKIVLAGMPAPKGKIKTFPEIDFVLGNGTKPTEFENDKSLLKNLVAEFLSKENEFPFQPHATFGPFTKMDWGRIIYIHFDHHLKQFGA